MERWSFYIDVEGFKAFLSRDRLQAIKSLGEMMRAIFRIGRECYPLPPDVIYAHQFGDGFIVTSREHEESLDRCVAVATAVMRHVAASGCYARAAIAEGDLADIQGVYPEEVMSQSEGGHRISLHMGLMTITSVMGTALTRTVGLAEAGKPSSSGPLLLVSVGNASRVDASIPRVPIPGNHDVVSIDWVRAKSDILQWIQTVANLGSPTAKELEDGLAQYCAENDEALSPDWKANVHRLLGVGHTAEGI